MQTTTVKLVIFDCDGVLIDSEVLSMEAWQEVLTDYNISLSKQYFIDHFLGKSVEHVEKILTTHFCFELTDAVIEGFHALLYEKFEHSLRRTPGVINVLSNLDAHNIPYCVATSSSPERTTKALKSTGLFSYFEGRIFTRSMVKNGKPAPDLFLHAAATMGIKPENCLVIEDSQPGLAAAVAAKMNSFHFTGGAHLHSDIKAGTTNDSKSLNSWDEFYSLLPDIFDARKINE
ncbi:HAD family phosphatase [Alteromonas sp. BL110]|uniref:HAD family hydrolase n=1 Tax=Alteromonas sp. BL110 TaxID=1714845 RepID=UPI000E4B7670|nr:HAD family phosphatase [Alteromonas sp. BL110]AXT40607.1 HAD family phosphatase [Alteromonas sp. BL110]RKM79843.1 HAD family hydrolase [Alteromonas sp. BL110]